MCRARARSREREEPQTGALNRSERSTRVTAKPKSTSSAAAKSRQAPTRRNPDWTTAWLSAFGAVVVVCIILTITISVIKTKRHNNLLELTNRIEAARATDDPENVIRAMQDYLLTGPSESLAQRANEELNRALNEIENRYYRTAIAYDRADSTDLDKIEISLRDYLAKHPDGAHRLDVLERLEQIPRRRDDRAFARAQANAEAAGDDLDLQSAAWQAYLEQYPEGAHSIQARAEIARIPDQLDERMHNALLREAQELAAANRMTDAILRLESGSIDIKSPRRLARLAEEIAALEAGLEISDAAGCLGAPAITAEARERIAARCRLYLLCYPKGRSRAAVEQRLAELTAQERDELLAKLRARLSEIGDDPIAALAELDEFCRQPAASGADVSEELARRHFALLERSITSSLENMQLIRYQDGTETIGVILGVSPGWVQVKPRVSGDEEKPASRLVRSSEVTAIRAPLWEAWNGVRLRVRALLSETPVKVERILEEIRALRVRAKDELYHPERMALLVLLAGLDRSDQEARGELSAAGYAPFQGVYRALSEPSKAPPEADAARLAALDFYRAYLREQIPTEALRARLAESFDYTFLGTILTIPIEWEMNEPECSAALTSGASDPFQAKLTFKYSARARRTSDSTLPASILGELDRELSRLNQLTSVSITYEVRMQHERLNGVGMETRRQDAGLVVNRVFPESSAARAGVEPGDRIVLVDGRMPDADAASETLSRMIANSSAQGMDFGFVRGGRLYRVHLGRGEYSIDKYQVRSEIETRGPLSKERDNLISEWNNVLAPS